MFIVVQNFTIPCREDCHTGSVELCYNVSDSLDRVSDSLDRISVFDEILDSSMFIPAANIYLDTDNKDAVRLYLKGVPNVNIGKSAGSDLLEMVL